MEKYQELKKRESTQKKKKRQRDKIARSIEQTLLYDVKKLMLYSEKNEIRTCEKITSLFKKAEDEAKSENAPVLLFDTDKYDLNPNKDHQSNPDDSNTKECTFTCTSREDSDDGCATTSVIVKTEPQESQFQSFVDASQNDMQDQDAISMVKNESNFAHRHPDVSETDLASRLCDRRAVHCCSNMHTFHCCCCIFMMCGKCKCDIFPVAMHCTCCKFLSS